MAKVLLAWELGAGKGHLVNLLPLAQGLRAHGHRLFLALRDLAHAQTVFGGLGAAYLQSPYKAGPPRTPIFVPRSFAHLLYNVGFGDPPELEILVAAWRNLFEMIDPDLIVFEHSPTALLAARGCRARKVVLGNGFLCPPDSTPWPDLRPWMPPDAEVIVRGEELVLKNVNEVLRLAGQPPLERLAQLYAEVDDVLLTTVAEFDPYEDRSGARYRGPWLPTGGETPTWPAGHGPRIYAYLKSFPALPQLLTLLRQRGHPTIVSCDGLPPALLLRHAAANRGTQYQLLTF